MAVAGKGALKFLIKRNVNLCTGHCQGGLSVVFHEPTALVLFSIESLKTYVNIAMFI